MEANNVSAPQVPSGSSNSDKGVLHLSGDPSTQPSWHTMEGEEVVQQLSVNPESGLSSDEVQQRREKPALWSWPPA